MTMREVERGGEGELKRGESVPGIPGRGYVGEQGRGRWRTAGGRDAVSLTITSGPSAHGSSRVHLTRLVLFK